MGEKLHAASPQLTVVQVTGVCRYTGTFSVNSACTLIFQPLVLSIHGIHIYVYIVKPYNMVSFAMTLFYFMYIYIIFFVYFEMALLAVIMVL